jgi:hypothetical protein
MDPEHIDLDEADGLVRLSAASRGQSSDGIVDSGCLIFSHLSFAFRSAASLFDFQATCFSFHTHAKHTHISPPIVFLPRSVLLAFFLAGFICSFFHSTETTRQTTKPTRSSRKTISLNQTTIRLKSLISISVRHFSFQDISTWHSAHSAKRARHTSQRA